MTEYAKQKTTSNKVVLPSFSIFTVFGIVLTPNKCFSATLQSVTTHPAFGLKRNQWFKQMNMF